MANYDVFAKYYDVLVGDAPFYKNVSKIILKKIKRYNPKTKTILEIACGTGNILLPLSKKYKCYGLDLSEEMLKQARKKSKKIKFYRGDMRAFQVDMKFDTILCMFDSINHLLEFEDWKKTFKQVHMHLNKEGLFIFDINSVGFLKIIKKSQNPLVKTKDSIVFFKPESDKTGATWHIYAFKKKGKNTYQLHHESIKQVSFPLKKIKKELEKNFKIIEAVDYENKRATDNSKRIFFICKKKN